MILRVCHCEINRFLSNGLYGRRIKTTNHRRENNYFEQLVTVDANSLACRIFEVILITMFLGHYGLALAAKKVSPKTSLGVLVFASLFIDLIWPILLLLGKEEVVISPGITLVTPLEFTHYPFSHSLVVVGIWSLLIGVIYFTWRRSTSAAMLVGGLVLSHWLLDALVHRRDLPLLPSDTFHIGLGLWNSMAATLILEFGIFFIGLFIYWSSTHTRLRIGSVLLWGTAVLLSGIYLASVFGPPPPDSKMIAYAGLGQWLFVGLYYWMDRKRRAYI